MEIFSTLASIFTVISLVVFAGIVVWAWSGRREAAFAKAADAPFALPDEAPAARRVDRNGAAR